MIMDNVKIGPGAHIGNAIIDKNVVVPDGVRSASTPRRTGRPASRSPRRGSRCSARASPSPATTPAPA